MQGLIATAIAGLFFLIGASAARASKNTSRLTNISISIAAGTMIVLILGDFLPEIIGDNFSWWKNLIFVALGLTVLKALDFFIPEHDHNHDKIDEKESKKKHNHLEHIGLVTFLALLIHNFIEGTAIFASASSDFKTGALMAIAVGLHNIPMGLMIATSMKNEEKKWKKALVLFLAAISTLTGGIFMFAVGNSFNEAIADLLTCLAFGMILYLELFELIPHTIKSEKPKEASLGILAGIIIGLIGLLL